MGTAAKAVVELLRRTHRKRRRFFTVKRTAGGVIRPTLLEWNMPLNKIDNVDAIEQILLEGIRYHADAGLGQD